MVKYPGQLGPVEAVARNPGSSKKQAVHPLDFRVEEREIHGSKSGQVRPVSR